MYFYKERSNVTRKKLLTTKFDLWVDNGASTQYTLNGSKRAVGKYGILLQIEKKQ